MSLRAFFILVCGSLAACAPALAQESTAQPPSGRSRPSAPPAISTSGPEVTLDVVLIERPGSEGERGTLPSAKELLEMEKQGRVERVRRVRLSMLSGGKGMAQFGERVPVVTGRGGFAFGGRGGGGDSRQAPYSYTYESIGTLMSASSRVEDKGGVVVELQVEESRLVPSGKPLDDSSDAVALPKTTTLTSHSTLRLKPKEPVVAQASQFIAGGEVVGQFIVVTAEVDDSGDAQAAADERAAQIQVFNLKRSNAGEIQRVLASVFDGQTLRIGVNESTNAIIVSALPKQIQSIQAIVEALDAEK
jgi:type II secretory pathway component GspD/PulD (secretin)